MKVLVIINISNVDDLACDSGLIFQTILSNEFKRMDIDYVLVGPDVASYHNYIVKGARKLYVPSSVNRYSARFNFDWPKMEEIINGEKPDIIFNNQIELSSALRSVLVSNKNNTTRIISYCHYPSLSTARMSVPQLDPSLNHDNLGLPILFDVLSALLTSDRVVIQSHYAKSLLDTAAKYYHVENYPEVFVVPPPADPRLIVDSQLATKSNNVLYNHRLYGSYGTEEFLGFVNQYINSKAEIIFSDPMPRRSEARTSLNGTPAYYREKLSNLPGITLVDGNVSRSEYRGIITNSRLSFAAFRKACVWSMASVDCMGMGIPVIAPNYAAYPEFIPQELLFDSLPQAAAIMDALLTDDAFWQLCSEKCQAAVRMIAPKIIAGQFYDIFVSSLAKEDR